MARRIEVRKIAAPVNKVWAGLVLFQDAEHPIKDAIGNPGEVGSTVVQGLGSGDAEVVNSVMESGSCHFVRYKCKFRGPRSLIHRLAFIDNRVEVDYEIKKSTSSESSYIRAVTEYQAPLWPTGLSLGFALISLVGLNYFAASQSWIWAVLVAFWVLIGIGMQYLPRELAYRAVTKPVLAKLEDQARTNSFKAHVAWRRASGDMSFTEVLDMRPLRGKSRAG
jgi:hypothetical protein